MTVSQPFWGNMVAAAGAGPVPIPQRDFTTKSLSAAIEYCLSDEAKRAAGFISQKMQSEAGVQAAAQSFHRNLPIDKMACDLLPHLPATFRFSKGRSKIKMSSLATEMVLSKIPKIEKNLSLYAFPWL